MEVWRSIEGYSNYWISSEGRVWSNKKDGYLKLIDHPVIYEYADGTKRKTIYKQIDLMKDEIRHQGKLVHRLVATAFLPNPENKTDIDHLDGNCSNNKVSNLRWKTHSENMRNCKIRTDNKSGHKGISWCKRSSTWRATIYDNRHKQQSRYFTNIEDAVLWRRQKEVELGYTIRL